MYSAQSNYNFDTTVYLRMYPPYNINMAVAIFDKKRQLYSSNN